MHGRYACAAIPPVARVTSLKASSSSHCRLAHLLNHVPGSAQPETLEIEYFRPEESLRHGVHLLNVTYTLVSGTTHQASDFTLLRMCYYRNERIKCYMHSHVKIPQDRLSKRTHLDAVRCGQIFSKRTLQLFLWCFTYHPNMPSPRNNPVDVYQT